MIDLSARHEREKRESMCGIAGFSLSERAQRVDVDVLTRALLLGIENRGRDASGVAWHDETDGQVWLQKDAQKASDFVHSVELRGARSLIAHTRYGTKGSEVDNANNHPIEHHGIVGVHNGVIWNDDEIFDMLGCERHGQVDSEAAFALIARAVDELGTDDVTEVLPVLEGSAALAWLDVHDDAGTLHLARVASSPLWVAQTRLGSALFASTRQALLEASVAGGFRIKYLNELPEGSYLRLRNGRITDVRRFDKPDHVAPARTTYYPKSTRQTPVDDDWRSECDTFDYDYLMAPRGVVS